MSPFPARFFAAAAMAIGLSGCGAHYVARGADLYAGGHYIEAAEVFERTEARLESSSPDERARYGLYRGATLLALGDTRRAEQWLEYSREQEQAELSEDERLMLRRALRALDQRRPEAPPPSESAAVAASETLPVGTVKAPRKKNAPFPR